MEKYRNLKALTLHTVLTNNDQCLETCLRGVTGDSYYVICQLTNNIDLMRVRISYDTTKIPVY